METYIASAQNPRNEMKRRKNIFCLVVSVKELMDHQTRKVRNRFSNAVFRDQPWWTGERVLHVMYQTIYKKRTSWFTDHKGTIYFDR